MKGIVVIVSMLFSYYAIGGMATTNIMRLLAGETTKQSYPHCRCGACNHIIPVYHQFPLISYCMARGRCRYCGVAIPPLTTFIEISAGVIMAAITIVFGFRPLGVTVSFLTYEVFRWVMIRKYGRRSQDFWKEYAIAFAYIVLAYVLVMCMSLMYTYWC